MSSEATWYLGPLGDLRELVCPETDIEINPVRYGGIHQGLSGARTMDITGYRSEYTLEFKYLDQSEFLWLEALHARLVPGPFYLIDPLKKNRLTLQSSRLGLTEYNNNGVDISAPFTRSRDWPTDLAVPGRSLVLASWGSSTTVTFDQSKLVPLMSGEVLTASIYMKAAAVYSSVNLRISWYDADKNFLSNTDYPVSVGTSWARYWYTYNEKPSNAVAAKFSITLGTASTSVYLSAPQAEVGVNFPSSWDLGGAANQVLMDQIPTTSHRYPLRDASLTLLEA